MSLKLKSGRALLAALLVLLAIPAAIALGAPSTASACPPQGCHQDPDDPAPPHPPSPPQPRYRVFVDTLRAYETEDDFEDEAYILINGYKVWGPHGTNALQMQYPNVSRDITGPVWATLYDDDPDSWFDHDDWLGDAYAPLPTVVGATAWGSLRFTQDGADYTMGVRVLRLS
jgi:hypothetical protein